MIRHISYLGLDPRLRALAAENSRKQLRGMMSSTVMPPETVALINQRLTELDQWEHGTVPVAPVRTPEPPRQLPEHT